MTPFGTVVSFPILPESLLPSTVRFWRILMVAPSQDFFLVVPLSRFHDESTSPRILSAVFFQWYGSPCIESLDDFQRYHPPLRIPSLSQAART